MVPTFMGEADAAQGLQWGNLLVVGAVVLLGWPLYSRMRRSISRNRRARWAREERQAQPADGDER